MPTVGGANEIYSAAGTRGYVKIGLIGVIPRYSVASIALGDTGYSHNFSRTWWVVDDFDSSNTPKKTYMLPCENSVFNLGDDLYKVAEDAVPGAARVRASRCGAYSFKTNFPVIITNPNATTGAISEIAEAYQVVTQLVQKANYLATMNTSIQNRYYPCILDSFNISVNGYGGANAINCSLTTKGISTQPNMDQDPFRRSIITTTTRRDKEIRNISGGPISDPAPDIVGDAQSYGGRLATIKDCSLSLNEISYQQVVSMDLNIQHELKLASTAAAENNFLTPTIKSADRIFLTERKVTGKFQFLSSYASVMDLSALSPQNPSSNSLEGGSQWASSLQMSFGPDFVFDMPAVYWQPRVEEFSTGSPLITINFIARSNIKGVNEFRSGLTETV